MCERDAEAGYNDPLTRNAGSRMLGEENAKPFDPERAIKEKARAARRYALEAEVKNWSYEQLCKEIAKGNEEYRITYDRVQTLSSILAKRLD